MSANQWVPITHQWWGSCRTNRCPWEEMSFPEKQSIHMHTHAMDWWVRLLYQCVWTCPHVQPHTTAKHNLWKESSVPPHCHDDGIAWDMVMERVTVARGEERGQAELHCWQRGWGHGGDNASGSEGVRVPQGGAAGPPQWDLVTKLIKKDCWELKPQLMEIFLKYGGEKCGNLRSFTSHFWAHQKRPHSKLRSEGAAHFFWLEKSLSESVE